MNFSSRCDRFALDRSRVEAGDQPAAALERDVAPRPVERDRKPVLEADQKIDVRHAPQQPGEESGELELAELRDGAFAPDGRERAEIAIAEGRDGAALAARDDRAC